MAKRMVAVRLDEQLAARIDRLAAAEGVTRTEWCAQALARHALTAAGARPQAGDGTGDDERP